MSDKDPGTWSGIVDYWQNNRLPVFTILSAFAVALWSGLSDGKGWAKSLFGGVICVFIALALLVALSSVGLHQEWLSAVGIFVGFVGAERIRDAALDFWHVRKDGLISNKDNGDR